MEVGQQLDLGGIGYVVGGGCCGWFGWGGGLWGGCRVLVGGLLRGEGLWGGGVGGRGGGGGCGVWVLGGGGCLRRSDCFGWGRTAETGRATDEFARSGHAPGQPPAHSTSTASQWKTQRASTLRRLFGGVRPPTAPFKPTPQRTVAFPGG